MKQLWVLAGGNGSGKSTFYDRYLKDQGLSFVNADNLAKEISDEMSAKVSQSAQEQAMEACLQKLKDGETFCFETVFSHKSKIELIKKAKSLGYEVNLVFLHLSLSQLNVARVSQRVAEGGHDVPQEKIESRIPRSLENIKKAIPLVDNIALVDNSSVTDPLKVVVKIKQTKIVYAEKSLPRWADKIIKELVGKGSLNQDKIT